MAPQETGSIPAGHPTQIRACSSSGRAPLSHGGGTGFESPQVHHGVVAHQGERLSGRQEAVGELGSFGPVVAAEQFHCVEFFSKPVESHRFHHGGASRWATAAGSKPVEARALGGSTPSSSAAWWRRPALVPGTRLESERPFSGFGGSIPSATAAGALLHDWGCMQMASNCTVYAAKRVRFSSSPPREG